MATAPKTAVSTAAIVAATEPAVDFDTMFAQFSKPEDFATNEGAPGQTTASTTPAPTAAQTDAAKTPKVEAQAKVEAEETEIEGAPTEDEVEEKTAEQIAAEAAAAKAAEVEAAKTAAKPTDDALSRLADLIEGRSKDAAKVETQTQQPTAPLYSEADVATLTAFYKEWPEVAQAQEIVMRGVAAQITNHIFAEFAKVIGPKLALLDALADDATYNEISRAIPEYDETLQEKVVAWVAGQKPYLQKAYTSVMENGTVDEITDLIERYKQATGVVTSTNPPATATTAAPSPAPTAALSPVAKQAAARLAPVSSKRSAPTQGEPSSFEDAFAAFAKAG